MASSDPKTRYSFNVDWFDNHAQITRNYEFLFYPSDSSIEMYDLKARRMFLKRSKSNVKLEDLFLGAAINVNSRQLIIRDYADEFTKQTLKKTMER
jgi:nucleoside-diphosphate kinase